MGQISTQAGFNPASDPVIAKRAFLRGLGDRVQKAAPIRAGLDAKTAANAVFRINQHRSIGRIERRPHRADLHTGECSHRLQSFGTKKECRISSFGTERFAENRASPRWGNPPTSPRALRRSRLGFGDDITLDPGAEKGAFRDMILFFASLGAKSAADALIDIQGHSPFMLGRVIAFGSAGGDQHLFGRPLWPLALRERPSCRPKWRRASSKQITSGEVRLSWDLSGCVSNVAFRAL